MKLSKKYDRWDKLSLLIIILTITLLLYRWEMFPKFIDIYYHFSVAKNFGLVNGVVIHDFWEYAPDGRPHLYPPLFHLIIIILGNLGFKTEFLMKFVSFIVFPLLQLTSFFIFRKLFNTKISFYTIFLLTSSYSFYWFQTNMIPACLVIIFSIIVYYLIEKNKFISSSILLALSFYTHFGLSLVITLSLIIYMFLRKEKRKLIIKVLCITFILYLPWLLNIVYNISYLTTKQAVFILLKFHIILFLLALGGAYFCFRHKKKMYIPISYAISMISLLFFYPSLYFDGHNLFSWSLLGGVFLGNIHKKICLVKKKLVLIALLLILLLFTPVFFVSNNLIPNFKWEKGTFTYLLFYKPEIEDLNLIQTRNLELADYINKNTAPNDIFYTENAYLGGLITALTGRSQAGAMYHEVKPIDQSYKIKARIWIKEYNDIEPPPPNFKLIKDVSGFKIYVTDTKIERRLPSFKIPLIYIYLILVLLLALLYFDYKK